MKSFTATALEHFPLVKGGDDVAKAIVDACRKECFELEDGDVIAIAQKIFSKAENRIVRLRDVKPSPEAQDLARVVKKSPRFVQMILGETSEILKAKPDVLLVEDKRGLVCINAGIDKSNVEGKGNFALLPVDPDESARKCRSEIKRLLGRDVAVVVCDTYSRPFRRGQVNYAIGFAGIRPFRDYRGKKDMFGQILKVKNVAIIDEVAAAAELLMGQAQEAMPVVIFKGTKNLFETCENCGLKDLGISRNEDLFKGAL